jgi:hypothetical protein
LQFVQVRVESIEAVLQGVPVRTDPFRNVLEPLRLQPTQVLACFSTTGDQTGAFKNLEMLRDPRLSHRKRLRYLKNSRVPVG